jgi:hypothetical protein
MLSHTLTQQSNNETLNTKHSNNHNGTEEGFHVFNFQSYERNYSIYYFQIFVHFDNLIPLCVMRFVIGIFCENSE